MRYTIFFLLLMGWANTAASQKTGRPFGINLCGGEFQEKNLPGVYGKDYAYPTESDIEYFYQQGFKLITIPFKWERIQNTLNGPLDAENILELTNRLHYCAQRNIQVVLSMHNFGRYQINQTEFIIGSPEVSREHFSDVWMKISKALTAYSNIYGYEIMSEPHDMGTYDWFTTAQETIQSIRQVETKKTIIISGDNFAAAEKWLPYSDALKNLVDPSNKLLYDAHCYFDKNYSGRYKENYDSSGATEYTGVLRMMPFVRWLKDNNKQGFVGEYGIPDTDIRWLKLLQHFLKYLSENNLNGSYWAAGSLWDKYPLSVQPFVQADRPQMEILLQYKKTIPSKNSSYEFLLPASYLFVPNTTILPSKNAGEYSPASSNKKTK